MSSPNKSQQQAIDSSAYEDVIISAGAGSGKTFTLSQKIYQMISKGQIRPENLLVLTFTNNAAHEMKERIISLFKKNHSPYATEMLSCHVQTFDSFSLYLVTRYSARLGIAQNINNVDDDYLMSKKMPLLDQIFDEYYQKEPERMAKVLSKYNLRDDSKSKQVILDLNKRLDDFLPENREEFLRNYQSKYLSREFYHQIYQKAYLQIKDDVILSLRYAEFLDMMEEAKKENPETLSAHRLAHQNKDLFRGSYHHLIFKNEMVADVYEELLPLLDSSSPYDLLSYLAGFKMNNPDFCNLQKGKKDSGKEARGYLRDHLPQSLAYLPTEEEGYRQYSEKADDIELYLELEEELRRRIDEEKSRFNAFTFSDISHMALSLLTKDEFQDCAEEIRKQFTYLMIDEYQDTNDLQEAFLSALMKEDKEGKRAHLFCVGDAKQSIYGFRDSNVALFNKRIENYTPKTEEHYVISMNTNYRSQRAVLDDINYLFCSYMSKNHGDIDYTSEIQQLVSGRNEPKDMIRKEGYGITRLLYPETGKLNSFERKKKECLLIIADIKRRIRNKEMVSGHPVSYSDFCIIVRSKGGYSLYQELFQENGIPLNNKAKTSLKGVDAILALNSLLSLLDFRLHGSVLDFRHAFASVARSYLYHYSDQQIYDILSSKDSDLPFDEPIIKDIDAFLSDYRKESFSHIFLGLLDRFGVLSKLSKIGNIEDNFDKIESLYQMVRSYESLGEGISDFLLRFRNLNKYRLDLSSDTIYSSEDAVDLMSIHASKGLEREIVYLPCSYNQLSNGNPMMDPDYAFSSEYGILLPDYEFGKKENEEDSSLPPLMHPIYSIPYLLYRKTRNDPNRNEHVRLVYVALTRAKSKLIFVGNDSKSEESNRNYETLYGMLSYVPHVTLLKEEILSRIAPLVSEDSIKEYHALTKEVMDFHFPFKEEDFASANDFKYAQKVFSYDRQALKEELGKKEDALLLTLYESLRLKYEDHDFTLDDLVKMYYLDPSLSSFSFAFEKQMGEEKEEKENGEEDEEEESSSDKGEFFSSEEEMENALLRFYRNFRIDGEKIATGKIKPADIDKKKLERLPYFLVLDGLSSERTFVSYEKEGEYPDLHETLDISSEEKNTFHYEIDDPLKNNAVSDTWITFPEKKKKRASSTLIFQEDNDVREALDRGVRLHRMMELVSFTDRDFSFVKDEKDRKRLEKILSLPLFDGIREENVKKEFSYYDTDLLTYGSIDLLLIKDGHYTIVDYKTDDISHPEYDEQLQVYRENVARIFSVTEDKISGLLLSLQDATMRKVF